jgi:hypothetical protein
LVAEFSREEAEGAGWRVGVGCVGVLRVVVVVVVRGG